jgi:hypothetical protein
VHVKYALPGKDFSHIVVERQFPLVLGYAFTDYRSQGQTIPKVIVDIRKPKRGPPLSPFNLYVALSRGTGRDNIRILADPPDKIENTFKGRHEDMLLDEDDRLELLDRHTKEAFTERYGQR